MLAVYIIAGILLAIVIVLCCPVVAEVTYLDAKLNIKVKFLWLTIFPMKEKPPKKAKLPRKKKPVKKSKKMTQQEIPVLEEAVPITKLSDEDRALLEDNTKRKQKRRKKRDNSHKSEELREKIALIKMVIVSSKKGMKRLLKGIRFDDIAVDFIYANEDAADAAIGYGRLNIVVYNALSFLRSFFNTSVTHINITCKYNSVQSAYDGSLKVKLAPITAIAAGFSIAFRIFINMVKVKLAEKKEEAKKVNPEVKTAN